MNIAPEQTTPETLHATLHATDLKAAIEQCQHAQDSEKPTHLEVIATDVDLRCRGSSHAFGLEVTVPTTVSVPDTFGVLPQLLLEAIEACPGMINLTWDHSVLQVVDAVTGFSVRIPIARDYDAHVWHESRAELGASLMRSRDDRRPSATNWASLFLKAKTHASKDAARINLTGVQFEHDGETGTFAATDGHRMAVLRARFPSPKLSKGVVIPAEFGQILEPDCGISIAVDDDHLFFIAISPVPVAVSPISTGWVRLNKITFPPYRSVIPDAFLDTERPRITVDVRAFGDAVDSFAAIHRPRKPMIFKVEGETLQLKSQCVSHSEDPEGAQKIPVEGNLEYEGEIGIVAPYVRDALKMLDDKRIQIYYDDRFNAMVLADRSGDNLVICMPMRYE